MDDAINVFISSSYGEKAHLYEPNMPKLHATMTDQETFAAVYSEARRRERWIDADHVVRALPQVPRNHPHAPEWRVRSITLDRILTLLRSSATPLRILDVGCGNGWMSARLAIELGARVHGLDVTTSEIDQARRVWSDVPEVTFSVGSIHSVATTIDPVDVVLFAASLQYFRDARAVIDAALSMTHTDGTVVVADTPWYDATSIAAARARSRTHYASIGVGAMADHYFHHDLAQLDGLHVRTVPVSPADRLRWALRFRARPLFPLLQITRRP